MTNHLDTDRIGTYRYGTGDSTLFHFPFSIFKMRYEDFAVRVRIPTASDFAADYRNYAQRAHQGSPELFRAIMTAESFVLCAAVTELEQSPAVKGVAAKLEAVAKQRGKDLDEQERQFCGVVVRALMEANFYEKTGKKGRVGIAPFSRGEIYKRRDGIPNPFDA